MSLPLDITDILTSSSNCLILVHPSIQRLDRAKADLIGATPVSLLNIGQVLAAYLLNVPQEERSRAIIRWFDQKIDGCEICPLVCYQIDFLFLPALNLDPLSMFRKAAKKTRLVVLWPGDFTGKILSYAVPNHKHYRTWNISDLDLAIFRLND